MYSVLKALTGRSIHPYFKQHSRKTLATIPMNPIIDWATWPQFEKDLDVFLAGENSTIHSVEQGQQRLQACRNMCHEYLKIHIGSVSINLFYQASSWWLQEEGFDANLYLRSAKITSTQSATGIYGISLVVKEVSIFFTEVRTSL